MKLLRKVMPRRTFLSGLGASISLPILDAMTPAAGAAQDVIHVSLMPWK